MNARVAGSITPYSVEDRHVLLFIIVGCLSIVYLLHIFLSLVVGFFHHFRYTVTVLVNCG